MLLRLYYAVYGKLQNDDMIKFTRIDEKLMYRNS